MITGILIILLLVTVVIAVIIWLQYKVLFIPVHRIVWKPKCEYKDLAIPVKSDREIEEDTIILKPGECVPEGYINAWYFEMFPGEKVILFNHGNAGNISHREYLVKLGKQFGMNVFMYDYRGFGKSPGAPSASSILQDGEAAYKYLRTRNSPSDIIVWGESLGGAVATYIASKHRCSHLLLMCTFSSLRDAIENKDMSKWSKKAMSFLVDTVMDKLNTKEWIQKVKCPIVIIHSKEDDLIPYECGKILYRNIKHNCRLMITIKGTHSAPKIKAEQLRKLFYYCSKNSSVCPSLRSLTKMAQRIETVAEEHLKNW